MAFPHSLYQPQAYTTLCDFDGREIVRLSSTGAQAAAASRAQCLRWFRRCRAEGSADQISGTPRMQRNCLVHVRASKRAQTHMCARANRPLPLPPSEDFMRALVHIGRYSRTNLMPPCTNAMMCNIRIHICTVITTGGRSSRSQCRLGRRSKFLQQSRNLWRVKIQRIG